jgi:succinyl-diaminopimelate desuccinylase
LLAKQLIAKPSLTPNDAGCQELISGFLSNLGFTCTQHTINGVSNLIAQIGNGPVHFAFSGHTDVVAPGPIEKWTYPPFEPTELNGLLFGRGAADMKTGIAAMLSACSHTDWRQLSSEMSFWLLITSDEEGEADYGSAWIKQWLDEHDIELTAVLVGEPTAMKSCGDTIKLGRRGSLSGKVSIAGKQGHVAYPHLAVNAASIAASVASSLASIEFEKGSTDFPGTSLQITGLHSGSFSDNIIPGHCEVRFNVRYSDEFNADSLKAKLIEVIDQYAMSYSLEWERPCEAYLTQPKETGELCFINQIESCIRDVIGKYPMLSTAGGTSDGRFFASSNTQVIEVGVPNHSIHQIDEHIDIADLITLEKIYTRLLNNVLLE